MKTLRLILIVAGLACLLDCFAQAQAYRKPRTLQKIAPQTGSTNAPGKQANAPAPAAAPAPAHPAPSRMISTQALVRVIQPPVDPEKVRAAKEESLRKTIEFQKKRAAEGSESAQYELGVHYLKGEGVEKDEVAARKWLTLSAKNGYGPASKKLEDLDRPAEPPPAAADKSSK